MNIRQKKLPIAALEQIDDLCSDFERAWQGGQPRTIESVLPSDFPSPQREVLLAELVALEMDYRRRRGDSPEKAEYLRRFPGFEEAINDAVKDEVAKKSGFQPPTLERMSQLFPALEILELIGAGGMGAVYKARQKGLDRLVALKILPEEFGDDVQFALRFTREARTLAKLSHPNIVSVYEFGHVDETYYFLMEYVDGSTLRDIVRAGELKPQHALCIVPHLCDALQYAHDKGIVHRDIKPENILMAKDGAVKIADFGLSRILGSEHPQDMLTGTHQVMGTPRYMAPEHLEGSRNVDHRADIYSLGVVFYEMLTGELPIGHFAVPSEKVQIDVRLDEVVLRTLAKEPGLRYQRASQVKLDVESITSGDVALAKTLPNQQTSAGAAGGAIPNSLAQQELAGRMLLTRRQLMERVENSLRPLFRGQMLQVPLGIAVVVLGVRCWALNMTIPHRVVCGAILHVYGVLLISQALLVCTRIRRIDYSKPLVEVKDKLRSVRAGYLRAGVLIGFVWWLMWIPVCVALGFDIILHPNSLIPSLIVGILGLGVSTWFYVRAITTNSEQAEALRKRMSGNSLSSADLALEEMEQAGIS